MNIAGCCDEDFNDLDDVELVSLDPILQPLPECLNGLNSFPVGTDGHAGAVDYSSESNFQLPCSRKKCVGVSKQCMFDPAWLLLSKICIQCSTFSMASF